MPIYFEINEFRITLDGHVFLESKQIEAWALANKLWLGSLRSLTVSSSWKVTLQVPGHIPGTMVAKDEIAERDMVVTGDRVEQDDAVIANACLACGFQTNLERVGVEEEDGCLRCLDLIDELVGGICGVGATESGRQRGGDRDWVRWTRRRREEGRTYVTMPPTRCTPLRVQISSDQGIHTQR